MKNKPKTHFIKCNKCENEKSVKLTIELISDGVNVRIDKCTECKYQMSMDEVFPSLSTTKP